ncbi:MAG: PEP-CTERM sorting domain-containing protein [Verrucomicrobiota bacterium]
MKPIFSSLLLSLAIAHVSPAASISVPADDNTFLAGIPGVTSFEYDAYIQIGGIDSISWTKDTDAYSWDHPNLNSAFNAGSPSNLDNQTGWTHLTKWVALRVLTPVDLTIRIDQASGVMVPDQNNLGQFFAAGDDLVPAFTMWTGVEDQAESGAGGPFDPGGQGGHRWDNDGNETIWMDQLAYLTHDGNLTNQDFVEQTISLGPGFYTLNVAGALDGPFSAGNGQSDLRKGFGLTLTSIPEPSASLLLGISFVGLAISWRRRQS